MCMYRISFRKINLFGLLLYYPYGSFITTERPVTRLITFDWYYVLTNSILKLSFTILFNIMHGIN